MYAPARAVAVGPGCLATTKPVNVTTIVVKPMPIIRRRVMLNDVLPAGLAAPTSAWHCGARAYFGSRTASSGAAVVAAVLANDLPVAERRHCCEAVVHADLAELAFTQDADDRERPVGTRDR
jgi:hypothetical protein